MEGLFEALPLCSKDFLCSAMPSCPEAGQRAKLNRTCHSAQASLRSLLLEESCIIKTFQESSIISMKTLNKTGTMTMWSLSLCQALQKHFIIADRGKNQKKDDAEQYIAQPADRLGFDVGAAGLIPDC